MRGSIHHPGGGRGALARFGLGCLLFLLATASSAQRPAIQVPDDPFATHGRVYVLPVLFVPADRGGLVAAPADPTLDLDGSPMSLAAARTYHVARRNLTAHLRVAQEKYRQMLERPGDPPIV